MTLVLLAQLARIRSPPPFTREVSFRVLSHRSILLRETFSFLPGLPSFKAGSFPSENVD